jgi:RNA polymerase sigma factor (TIGR02999 family)
VTLQPPHTPDAKNESQNRNRRPIFLGYDEAVSRRLAGAGLEVYVDSEVSETTRLLLAWAGGDPEALDALTPHVYRELKRIAGSCMRGESEQNTLQVTALVHEVYLRLVDVKNVNWQSKAHFFALCARIMRRILVDGARKRATARHGGALGRVDLDDIPDPGAGKDMQLIALNDALEELNQADPRKAKIVELRYFGGLTVEETAAVLKVSQETVARDWRFTRRWLLSQLAGPEMRVRSRALGL